MKEEIWKDIKGYEGLYQVSNYGRVKSLERNKSNDCVYKRIDERILKQGTATKGYKIVVLYKNKTHKTCKVHRLVGEAFIPNPLNLPQINHKDENKSNNFVDNLEWCSNDYNNHYGTRKERAFKTKDLNGLRDIPIVQFDLNGKFIKEWRSATIACKEFLNKKPSHIYNCCKGKLKTAYGYIWKYKRDVN